VARSTRRRGAPALTLGALAVTLGCLTTSVAIASPAGDRNVRYRGYRVRVPAGWPVYDLRSHPGICVRFDRHAVYLGEPSPTQRCPAHAVGHTEAVLVAPLAARGARALRGGGSALGLAGPTGPRPPQAFAAELVNQRAGVAVTATWARHRDIVERALGTRLRSAAHTAKAAEVVRPALRARAAGATPGGVYTGPGFDACSAPSEATMSAWGASPYRAVGVYIGGANMACAQPNLTAAWVSVESAAGWHLIPTYVGLQAPSNGCGCAAINPPRASLEGVAAARDAISQAAALGIGPGNPIYFDMEGYTRGGTNTSAVLTFLAAWTAALHAAGYTSGVYSGGDSGISDLVAATSTGFTDPDDIWLAEWNGARNTSSRYVPAGNWSDHHRIHQYQGGHNERYGGTSINIDGNFLDGATAASSASSAASVIPDGTFVQVQGAQEIYEIAGGAPLLVTPQYWASLGAQQLLTISEQQFALLNPVPAAGTFLTSATGTMFRVAGGAPLRVSEPGLFPGVQSVTIDPWDLFRAGNPATHLNARPVDGTVVEGLPSGSYWVFAQGRRRVSAANATAVRVDESGLTAFPTVPCVVPRVRQLTLAQARRAIRRADCRLGTVHLRRPARDSRALRVVNQLPRPRAKRPAGYAVAVALG
jgi:hypothetical protein